MRKLYIKEIFYTLQGEGARAGEPSIFVRLAGCNLNCHFCDTDWLKGSPMFIDEILAECQKYKCKYIVWTGGEPTLQLKDDIISYFKENGYKQAIETNGTKPIPNGIDYISVSPKKYPLNSEIKKVSELRIVYPDFYDKSIIQALDIEYDNLYLSPRFDSLELDYDRVNEIINIIKDNPKWRLSIQQHKIWHIS